MYFDVTTVVLPNMRAEQLQQIATRIRQLGSSRILYGSDPATGGNLPPKEGWAAFRKLPLSEQEFRTIAENVPSYLR
jgi:predicted TIM-barrel fold metal-dependent hydrolase